MLLIKERTAWTWSERSLKSAVMWTWALCCFHTENLKITQKRTESLLTAHRLTELQLAVENGPYKETWLPREYCVFEWRGRQGNTEMYFLLRWDKYSSWQEGVFLIFPHFSDEEVYRPRLNYKLYFHLAQDVTACRSCSPVVYEEFTPFIKVKVLISHCKNTLYQVLH